ncbi:hypothetical protein GE061_002772 [Apolygus lucorum]|uniref:TOG domain-containing protein n=1 Tax=Apolygus lucorum TaxID=248454 RepID=A0A8S9X7X0_APOLU|nr:hypothetical protein GE061_002772 [Apolygus lucorum]
MVAKGKLFSYWETPTRRVLIPTGSTPASRRSNSAVDLQAAQRAKARAQYAALARQKVGSNASLPRPKKSDGPSSLTGPPSPFSPEHSRQGRSRTTRVSQSQPSSRSGSPSSRLNYATFTSNVGDRSRRSPSYSGSRSGATSRETSPGRYGMPPTSGSSRRGGSSIRSTLPSRPPLLSQRILHQSLEAESALADALGETNNVLTSPRRTRLEDHSDDSETSSVCSERSFESNPHRRTSDSFSWSGSQSRLYRELWEPCLRDINEIMLACESTHWSDRKDGLVSLSAYLQAGNTLSPHQLARITDNFTKMLSDSHTKVFTLFLDTVSDLITTHCSDLHQWLYVLLTRLFHKLGSDLLTSVQAKIMRTLDTVREAFGPESVLGWALRFLVDPTQTPNARVKLAVLQWLAKTAPLADPSTAFPSVTGDKDITALALTKMIGWTMGDSIKQGTELRRAAQEAILALFNLNTPYVTLRFAQLPKEYQEAAASLIQGRVRKASGSLDSPGSKQESCLSPDQVYRSIKRTTAEIQSYTCDSKVADTASHDSGISQMSLNDKNDIDLLSNWTAQLSLSSPTRSTNGLDVPDTATNGLNGTSELTGHEDTLGKTLDTIDTLAGDEKKLALSLLATHVKEADPVVISHHFKRILRIILGYIQGDLESREASLSALCEMLKKRTLGSQLQSFTELILINVIKAYSDPNRELAKHTEPCIEEIATALMPDIVLRVLIPLMTAGTYPYNLSVIKAITKVIEAQPDAVLLPFLPELMPGLIQYAVNDDCSVSGCHEGILKKRAEENTASFVNVKPNTLSSSTDDSTSDSDLGAGPADAQIEDFNPYSVRASEANSTPDTIDKLRTEVTVTDPVRNKYVEDYLDSIISTKTKASSHDSEDEESTETGSGKLRTPKRPHVDDDSVMTISDSENEETSKMGSGKLSTLTRPLTIVDDDSVMTNSEDEESTETGSGKLRTPKRPHVDDDSVMTISDSENEETSKTGSGKSSTTTSSNVDDDSVMTNSDVLECTGIKSEKLNRMASSNVEDDDITTSEFILRVDNIAPSFQSSREQVKSSSDMNSADLIEERDSDVEIIEENIEVISVLSDSPDSFTRVSRTFERITRRFRNESDPEPWEQSANVTSSTEPPAKEKLGSISGFRVVGGTRYPIQANIPQGMKAARFSEFADSGKTTTNSTHDYCTYQNTVT